MSSELIFLGVKAGKSKDGERDFARLLLDELDRCKIWADQYHPSIGSTTGQPDIQLLGSGEKILPIELKVGKVEDGFLVSKDIRPDQVRWHLNFKKFGGVSGFLVGVPLHLEGYMYWSAALIPSEYWERNETKIPIERARFVRNVHDIEPTLYEMEDEDLR